MHLNASNEMLSELGIYQHHDAIAGTAKQHVADDYARRMAQAMEINTISYSKLVDEQVKSMSGYSLPQNSDYHMCSRVNGTYLDCPIG
jgi:hypothetical protein